MTNSEGLAGSYLTLRIIPSEGDEPVLLGSTMDNICIQSDRLPLANCVYISAGAFDFVRTSPHQLVIDAFDGMGDDASPIGSYVFSDPSLAIYDAPVGGTGHLVVQRCETYEFVEADE